MGGLIHVDVGADESTAVHNSRSLPDEGQNQRKKDLVRLPETLDGF